MRTPKIEALHRLINYYNDQSEELTLPLLGIDESPLFLMRGLRGGGHSDARRARLSSGGCLQPPGGCLQPPARLGFVEGDGHFGLSVPSASLEKARGNVSPRFSIDQKEKRGEVSNGPFMEKIEKTFGGTLKLRDRGNL